MNLTGDTVHLPQTLSHFIVQKRKEGILWNLEQQHHQEM